MKILKNTITLIIIICTSQNLIAQKNYTFEQLLSQTNSYLNLYSHISPFDDEVYAIKDFKLTKADIKEIHALNSAQQNMSPDSVDKYDFTYFLQEKIMTCINKLTQNESFIDCDIAQLLQNDELSIVKSDDGKLYNFSIDEKSGGTYRSRISMMYYTDLDSTSQPASSIVNRESHQTYQVFDSDGYGAIYAIETNEGTKYVLTGGVKGCSTCYRTSILLVKFKDGIFISEFYYAVDSRSWETGVAYLKESKTIEVSYVTDDLTPYCNCDQIYANESDPRPYDEIYDDSKKQKCYCKFEFTGWNFELTKVSWEKVDN